MSLSPGCTTHKLHFMYNSKPEVDNHIPLARRIKRKFLALYAATDPGFPVGGINLIGVQL